MRILNFYKCKCDKRYLIVCLITVFLAIICGIVLHICSGIGVFTYNFADTYIFYIVNFKNISLFFSHLVVDLFYFYVFFLIGYYTKLKYLTCPVLFLKCLFAVMYAMILFTCFSIEGIIVALIVFLPSFLISSILCVLICDCCKYLKKSIVFYFAAVLALISTLIFLLLVNLLFRVLIVIV